MINMKDDLNHVFLLGNSNSILICIKDNVK